jgi:membrane-bound lytic murein transglycosylase D
VRDYHSPTFGFASRNFYVSFLAALAVTQDPHKYFGDLPHSTPVQFHELRLPARAGLAQLLRTLNVDRRALEQLNPALRPAVWSGRRAIPAGYVLRLPASGSAWTAPLLAQRLTSAPAPTAARAVTVVQRTPEAAARPLALAATTPVLPGLAADAGGSALQAAAAMAQGPQFYLVQPQDTISTIADRTGVPLGQLMTLNAMPDQDFLYEGERLRLVPGAPAPGTATTPAMAALAQQAVLEDRQEDQAVALASQLAATAEPVSAGEAQAEGPQLLPRGRGRDTGPLCAVARPERSAAARTQSSARPYAGGDRPAAEARVRYGHARSVRAAPARVPRAAAGDVLRLAPYYRYPDLCRAPRRFVMEHHQARS